MASEIIIELDNGKNGCVLFPPLMEIRRGRITPEGWGSNPPEHAGELKTVPGYRFALNIAGRSCRNFDPLALEEEADTLARVNACLKVEHGNTKPNITGSPGREQRRDNLPDNVIASWHYWMKRLVEEDKFARLIQGTFMDQSKLPGRVRLDYQTQPMAGPVYADQMEQVRLGTYAWPGTQSVNVMPAEAAKP